MNRFKIVLLFSLVYCFVILTTHAQQVYSPVKVTKSVSNKVYVHLMPWFESEDYSGSWGQHWTMSTMNPDTYDSDGQREIASYYYPLTGPYDSADPDLIEYQLLLMKLSGIDGVLIDWPGSYDALDYSENRQNAEALIEKLPEVGIDFAIVYEDHNLELSGVTDQLSTAQSDMNYAQSNYFTNDQYIYINDQPLLLDFGPQTIESESEWTTVFSNISPKPYFLTLWYEHDDAGSNCCGEFAWVYQDDTPYLTHLSNFYQYATNYGIKMGAACPGFNSFYEEGGWGSSDFVIDHNDLETFEETLDLALDNNAEYIQLVTWNDYGEGTMIEPTVEFGYGCLTYLQEKLGVDMGQDELELVYELYQQRKEYAGDTDEQERLDQVFYYLVSLQIDAAEELLTGTGTEEDDDEAEEGVSGLGGTYYIQNRKSGLVMDVYYGGTDDGVNILQYTNGGTSNQQFTLTEVATGVYSIMNVNSGKMVDVAGNSTEDFANIQQWSGNDCECQHFEAISTGDGYYKFKAMHSSMIIEVGYGSTEENANINQYTDNSQICGQWELIPVSSTSTWSSTIEAESYDYYSGIDTETCDEGGENVDYIDTGDWMVYMDIEFPYSGTYTVSYRVASESTGGQLVLTYSDGTVTLDNVDIPVTGGWQTWTTVSRDITIDAGTYNLGINAASGGWNINWFSLTYSGLKTSAITNSVESSQINMDIYPNPVSTQLHISGVDKSAKLKVYSVSGEMVKTGSGNYINVASLPDGMYLLQIDFGQTIVTKSFIKK